MCEVGRRLVSARGVHFKLRIGTSWSKAAKRALIRHTAGVPAEVPIAAEACIEAYLQTTRTVTRRAPALAEDDAEVPVAAKTSGEPFAASPTSDVRYDDGAPPSAPRRRWWRGVLSMCAVWCAESAEQKHTRQTPPTKEREEGGAPRPPPHPQTSTLDLTRSHRVSTKARPMGPSATLRD